MRTGARCFGLPIYQRYRPSSSSLASIRFTISISQSSILPLRSRLIFSYKSSTNLVPEADTPADIIEVPVVNLSSAVDPEPVVPKRLVAILKAYAHQFDHYIRWKPQPCTSHDRSIKLSLHLSTPDPFELYLSSNIDLYFCEPTIPKGSLNPQLHLNLKSSFSKLLFSETCPSTLIPWNIFLDRIPPLSYPRMPIVELLNAAHK